MTSGNIIDIVMRGGAAGLLLLLSLIFALSTRGRGFKLEALGVIFTFGTAVYILISTPLIADVLSPILPGLIVIATFNSVFFWWFATALFEDEFRWQGWRFIPLVLLVVLVLWRIFLPSTIAGPSDNIAQQILIIGMIAHVMWLALAHLRDDLLEGRRKFRILFAAIVGLTALMIAFGEIYYEGRQAPQGILNLQSAAIFALALGFSVSILRPVPIFDADGPRDLATTADGLAPEDKVDLDALNRAMDGGIYKRDGLSIRTLADEINVPEHRLRRLINQQLGFRNFSAYLNQHRLRDARDILSDPAQSRRQIIQIAFDLGYGSVAPFNRAFKSAEGVSPTAYRRVSLRTRDTS